MGLPVLHAHSNKRMTLEMSTVETKMSTSSLGPTHPGSEVPVFKFKQPSAGRASEASKEVGTSGHQ